MPTFFHEFFDALYTMPLGGVIIWTLLENFIIFGVCLVMGELIIRRYQKFPITPAPPPVTRTEILLALSCVLLNALVTVVGALLWRAGYITVRYETTLWGVVIDTLVLLLAMDLAMYIFHRVAHHPRLFSLVHSTHHRFENPRPLTLFVLNPFEVLGFGGLWLVVLMLYPASWLGIIIYLTLNIVFGLVGHVGVEPFPDRWLKLPLVRLISTSTFHAEHHLDREHNYGFYTVIWDRLFRTISQVYQEDFLRARGTKL
jgi:Delta7-sterol 5-desaturase